MEIVKFKEIISARLNSNPTLQMIKANGGDYSHHYVRVFGRPPVLNVSIQYKDATGFEEISFDWMLNHQDMVDEVVNDLVDGAVGKLEHGILVQLKLRK